jgi:hypothetical protein
MVPGSARLARAVERLATPNDDDTGQRTGELAPKLTAQDRLFLRLDDRMGFVKVADIVSIVADGDYSVVRLATGPPDCPTLRSRAYTARPS